MNVLVTGIDGFVGRHLAAALLRIPDIHLYGTVRDLTAARASMRYGANVTLLQADVTELDHIRAAITTSAPEKIFHLAGQAFVPVSIANPRETFHTNVVGTLNILETLRERNDTRKNSSSVLVVSSGEVYGAVHPENLPINEQAPLNPANPYAVSKACVDMIAQQYRATFGIDVVVARPFNHLGPGQSQSFVGSAFAKQIAEIKLGKHPPELHVGNLDPQRDFTDVRDVVQAYIQLLQHPQKFSVFNVCSGTAVPVKKILECLCEISGVKLTVLPDPARLRSNEIPKILGDATRLRTATGWKPTIPLEQTLNDIFLYWEDIVRRSA
jgi:GDP-4-dehydro-6-deoxy-D-mannose reductase